jgi:hypothetical protein
MYWIVFMIVLIMTSIIFLNFIIAEVSASYQSVKDTIHYKTLQEMGLMINEAEDVLRARYNKERIRTWKHMFPRYIIKRELDE